MDGMNHQNMVCWCLLTIALLTFVNHPSSFLVSMADKDYHQMIGLCLGCPWSEASFRTRAMGFSCSVFGLCSTEGGWQCGWMACTIMRNKQWRTSVQLIVMKPSIVTNNNYQKLISMSVNYHRKIWTNYRHWSTLIISCHQLSTISNHQQSSTMNDTCREWWSLMIMIINNYSDWLTINSHVHQLSTIINHWQW